MSLYGAKTKKLSAAFRLWRKRCGKGLRESGRMCKVNFTILQRLEKNRQSITYEYGKRVEKMIGFRE